MTQSTKVQVSRLRGLDLNPETDLAQIDQLNLGDLISLSLRCQACVVHCIASSWHRAVGTELCAASIACCVFAVEASRRQPEAARPSAHLVQFAVGTMFWLGSRNMSLSSCLVGIEANMMFA